MNRLAHRLVDIAARRWPADLATDLSREWHAELAALGTRSVRALTFAASLALSPAVEAAGEAPYGWRERAAAAGRFAAVPAGVVLSAGALFDLVHLLARYALPPGRVPADLLLLTVAAAAMAALGGVVGARYPGRPAAVTVPVGLAAYGFLLAGNRVAVMPFMGWRDILPGVAAWTVLTSVAATVAYRYAGRRRVAVVTGLGGTLLALDAATVCGSAHAATVLHVDPWSAPRWFPLALLPGGTGGHVPALLLGNAAAMVGPLLLCSAFVLAYTVTGPTPGRAPRAVGWLPAGLGLAVLAVAVRPPDGDTFARLVDNTTTFGFGFASTLPGRTLLAALVAVLAVRSVAVARADG